MEENNLVDGFNEEEKEEQEEIRRYGIKQKQKKKSMLNYIINILLCSVLLAIVIYIFYLRNQIARNHYEINILTKQRDELINALNEGKKEINRLSSQSQKVQNKAFALLDKCFEESSSLREQIQDLRKEAEDNDNNNNPGSLFPFPIIEMPPFITKRWFPFNIF